MFTPHSCPKIVFWLGGFNIFISNVEYLFGLAYPESLNQIWLFADFEGFTHLFCPKNRFWHEGGVKIFHPQSHSFIGLGLTWKFGYILFSRSWDIKLSPAWDGDRGGHTLWLYRKPQRKHLLNLTCLGFGLGLGWGLSTNCFQNGLHQVATHYTPVVW